MQLHEVDEIRELFLVEEVNEALQDGWKIVAVATSAEPGATSVPVVCYVLGRRKPKPALKVSAEALAKANRGL